MYKYNLLIYLIVFTTLFYSCNKETLFKLSSDVFREQSKMNALLRNISSQNKKDTIFLMDYSLQQFDVCRKKLLSKKGKIFLNAQDSKKTIFMLEIAYNYIPTGLVWYDENNFYYLKEELKKHIIVGDEESKNKKLRIVIEDDDLLHMQKIIEKWDKSEIKRLSNNSSYFTRYPALATKIQIKNNEVESIDVIFFYTFSK